MLMLCECRTNAADQKEEPSYIIYKFNSIYQLRLIAEQLNFKIIICGKRAGGEKLTQTFRGT
jgi:hypothetical protein